MTSWKAHGTRQLGFRTLPWLLIVAALWIGSSAAGNELPDEMTLANIIVEFSGAMPPSEGDEAMHSGGQADIADRILSRLELHVRETARVFERLPLIALSANAETMLRLIAMPEVVSVRPDRNIRVLPSPSTDNVGSSPGEIDIPGDSDAIAIPEVPIARRVDDLTVEPPRTQGEAVPMSEEE